jgi:hypothetical protein
VPEYVRRFFQIPQMDIDYTLWQMLYLCIAPSRVYRTTKYHKQTKNQWARDGLFPHCRSSPAQSRAPPVGTATAASFVALSMCRRACDGVLCAAR